MSRPRHPKKDVTAKKPTKTHSFTIYLDGVKTLTDRLANRLYEAGCADATIAFQDGELAIDYDRTAASLDQALAIAVRELLQHGYRIRRIEVARPSQRASLNKTHKRRPTASA